MDYEALAQEIARRAERSLDQGWRRGMRSAAQLLRERVPPLRDDLEQKIAQVEVRLGKRLADLERAQRWYGHVRQCVPGCPACHAGWQAAVEKER